MVQQQRDEQQFRRQYEARCAHAEDAEGDDEEATIAQLAETAAAWRPFDRLDVDRDGEVSIDELTSALGGGQQQQQWLGEGAAHRFIKQRDVGVTGTLSFEDFAGAYRSAALAARGARLQAPAGAAAAAAAAAAVATVRRRPQRARAAPRDRGLAAASTRDGGRERDPGRLARRGGAHGDAARRPGLRERDARRTAAGEAELCNSRLFALPFDC